MSMVKERPQLSLDELHQVRWLLGGLLALVALSSVWYLDPDSWPLLAVASLCAAVTLVWPGAPARLPRWVHKLAFPATLAAFCFDLYTFGQVLPALVRLAVLLLLYRVISYRRRRDDLQLILLGLFLIVVTGVLTVSIGFAIQIIAFSALALLLLLIRGMVDVSEATAPWPAGAMDPAPTWTRVHWLRLFRRVVRSSDPRVWVFSVFLFAGLVALSGLLFMAIPRFQFESALFMDRWLNKRSVTGFTDTLRFGEVADIQKDDSVAMRIEVPDPGTLPRDLYWRMVVLDEYREHTFRLSPALRLATLNRDVVHYRVGPLGLPKRGNGEFWTFYLEPGVSRYLPIAGDFVQLRFTEPQRFRVSPQLRILELSREATAMKAYRVEEMETSGTLRDPAFGRRLSGKLASRRGEPSMPTFLDVPFVPEERARWIQAVAEITGGRSLNAVDFSNAARAWLHRRHGYSLQSRLPPGSDDPLTRWTFSREPGHCELFAGAFAMLARTAGFPTRVVGGFLGGTWNGDYLMVRNSQAHAWTEIYDSSGAWLRVDPTVPDAQGGTDAVQNDPAFRNLLRNETGWAARLDRLRVIWYRRIVNFEQKDQANLVRSLKQRVEHSAAWLKALVDAQVRRIKHWTLRPWGLERVGRVAAPLALLGLGYWAWRAFGRDWLSGWKAARSRRPDPVRREAGRWLSRLSAEHLRTGAAAPVPVIQDLQRLRFGAPAGWPKPEPVFRRAAAAFKALRRQRRRLERS